MSGRKIIETKREERDRMNEKEKRGSEIEKKSRLLRMKEIQEERRRKNKRKW